MELLLKFYWVNYANSNIDRLFAIWQDLYDAKYLKWMNESGDSKIALAPFHKDVKGTSYTSITCSFQQKDLGYTYPELQKWLDKYKKNGVFDKQQYQKQLRTTIELKYSTTGKSALLLPENDRIATAHVSALSTQNLAVENFHPTLLQKAVQTRGNTQKPLAPPTASWEENDYIVNVVYDRCIFNFLLSPILTLTSHR